LTTPSQVAVLHVKMRNQGIWSRLPMTWKILSATMLSAALMTLTSPVFAQEKDKETAARAACFKEAHAAAAKQGQASTLPQGECGEYAYDASPSCCRRVGIKP